MRKCIICEKFISGKGNHDTCSRFCYFHSRIVKDEKGCYNWKGKMKGNIPIASVENQIQISAITLSYFFHTKRLEKNLTRKCGNKFCVNPIHIEETKEKDLKKFITDRCAENENGCWIWKLSKNRHGYGVAKHKKKYIEAHRLAYIAFKGAIEEKNQVCHSCDVRNCVNPSHLWIGSCQENISDSLEKERHSSLHTTRDNQGRFK